MSTIINSDIYQINQFMNELEKKHIPETEETLAIGMYGHISEVGSACIQTSLTAIGNVANEVFAPRAKYDKNVIMHASQNLTDINAYPAKMNVIMYIAEADLLKLMTNNTVVIYKDCKFFAEDFEYHLDYDLNISKVITAGGTSIYSARYIITKENPISKIVNPYLLPPTTAILNGASYVCIQCTLSQIELTTVTKKLLSSSLIENKTFDFEFENQLASFSVTVTEASGATITLDPIFEGSGSSTSNSWCLYSYIDTNRIRVKFDSLSYVPKINANIDVEVMTTKGDSGNFEYNSDIMSVLDSVSFNYSNTVVLIKPQTDSAGGYDKKSINELRRILPKESMSRGTIINETDLDNYFNMVNTDTNKLYFRKKVDNQGERRFYSYIVMKDSDGNVMPTNTIKIQIAEEDFTAFEDGVYTLKQGSYILYNTILKIGTVVKNPTQEQLDAADFIYSTPFTVCVNKSPLYASSYMTIVSETPYLNFDYINQNSEIQFISTNISWKRQLLTDTNTYKLQIQSAQNINIDRGMIVETKDSTGAVVSYTNNMRVIAVIYNEEGIPYRWAEAALKGYDLSSYLFSWQFDFTTTDSINSSGMIRIENVYNINTTELAFGYFNKNVKVDIYMLAKFGTDYGREVLDGIVPGLDGYTVCNMYGVSAGVNFFTNYSEIMSLNALPTQIVHDTDLSSYGYAISGLPVIQYAYTQDEYKMQAFIKSLNYKKIYIDNAISVLKNSFLVDLKFYNTYGPSSMYTVSNDSYLDRVNLTLRFELKTKASADKNIRLLIISSIKEIIEDINNNDSRHMPNITTQIETMYKDSISYLEFLGFNDYGPGYQHIYLNSSDDITIVPELVTVNVLEDGLPDIRIRMA